MDYPELLRVISNFDNIELKVDNIEVHDSKIDDFQSIKISMICQ